MVRMLKDKKEWDAALKDAGSKLVVVDFTATWWFKFIKKSKNNNLEGVALFCWIFQYLVSI